MGVSLPIYAHVQMSKLLTAWDRLPGELTCLQHETVFLLENRVQQAVLFLGRCYPCRQEQCLCPGMLLPFIVYHCRNVLGQLQTGFGGAVSLVAILFRLACQTSYMPTAGDGIKTMHFWMLSTQEAGWINVFIWECSSLLQPMDFWNVLRHP